ncbi:cytochrome P450 [Amycolatopsis lurida]|uniref:cytochrome P450 n=1 Tax=Amycolatopsis lurida TaxID=31959 RepID=UPI003655F303
MARLRTGGGDGILPCIGPQSAQSRPSGGVARITAASIIGADKATAGFLAAKKVHEELLLAGPLPVRLLRAAQFHEFVGQLLDWQQGDVVHLPALPTQLVACRTVAEELVDLAVAQEDPGPPIPEIAGPRKEIMADAARLLAARRGIPAGSLVICSIPAANRDPALIDDPETFDITRGTTGHVAFGHGPHHCLGAPLARMELRIALPALLRRFPDLALADPEEPLDFRVFSLVYGVRTLRVTW